MSDIGPIGNEIARQLAETGGHGSSPTGCAGSLSECEHNRPTARAELPAGYGNWSVVVDHVPGQGWEACIEGEDGGGWEAQDAHTLLTYVASDLARTAGDTGNEAESIRDARMTTMSYKPTLADALTRVDHASAELAAIRAANEGLGDYTGKLDEPDAEMAELDALLTLAGTVREHVAYPPGTPIITNSRESYPAVVLTPPAIVAGFRVLAWAGYARRDGEYPGGIVLCVTGQERAGGPEYIIWDACTPDGGRTWSADAGQYTGSYKTAWGNFTKRAQQSPATD
jgi:hypothetical protein